MAKPKRAFFKLDAKVPYPTASMKKAPSLEGSPWVHGGQIKKDFKVPLKYALSAGNFMAIYDEAYPLIRGDLLEALQAVGVDNLQLFEVAVTGGKGAGDQGFKAFNLVGRLKSNAERAATTLHIFRDEEIRIVVDEAVKAEVERRAIVGVTFDRLY